MEIAITAPISGASATCSWPATSRSTAGRRCCASSPPATHRQTSRRGAPISLRRAGRRGRPIDARPTVRRRRCRPSCSATTSPSARPGGRRRRCRVAPPTSMVAMLDVFADLCALAPERGRGDDDGEHAPRASTSTTTCVHSTPSARACPRGSSSGSNAPSPTTGSTRLDRHAELEGRADADVRRPAADVDDGWRRHDDPRAPRRRRRR